MQKNVRIFFYEPPAAGENLNFNIEVVGACHLLSTTVLYNKEGPTRWGVVSFPCGPACW